MSLSKEQIQNGRPTFLVTQTHFPTYEWAENSAQYKTIALFLIRMTDWLKVIYYIEKSPKIGFGPITGWDFNCLIQLFLVCTGNSKHSFAVGSIVLARIVT